MTTSHLPSLTPARAIRAYCIRCCGGGGGNRNLDNCPTGCNSPGCTLYGYRLYPHPPIPTQKPPRFVGPRLMAIKWRCIDCRNTRPEVKECPKPECPLYPYRLGHNPTSGAARRSTEHLRRFSPPRQERHQNSLPMPLGPSDP